MTRVLVEKLAVRYGPTTVLDGVDVAMTEASVGAGISTVLVLSALYLEKFTQKELSEVAAYLRTSAAQKLRAIHAEQTAQAAGQGRRA